MWSVVERQKALSGFVVFYIGVQSVADVMRRGILMWFGHLEHYNVDDCMSACSNVVVTGVRCVDRGRKTWRDCVKDDMKLFRLQHEMTIFRVVGRNLIRGGNI